MRHLILLYTLALATVATGQQLKIASAEITFEFPSKKVTGSIEGFESTSSINEEHPDLSVFKGSVDAATLDTNNGLRNWSLRSSRYFNVKQYPKIIFESKQVRKSVEKWNVSGDVTLKGITRSLNITFIEQEGRLKGKASLYSSDFDITIKKKREDNLVKINFDVKLVE